MRPRCSGGFKGGNSGSLASFAIVMEVVLVVGEAHGRVFGVGSGIGRGIVGGGFGVMVGGDGGNWKVETLTRKGERWGRSFGFHIKQFYN